MSDILSIGATGITAAQWSLETIANNIANASTPGYNRQVTQLGALAGTQMGGITIGSGVAIQSVQRVVNEFLVQTLRNTQANLNEAQAVTDILDNIDSLISDPSISFSEGLNNYFAALQEVNNDPTSMATRQLFLNSAQMLATRINQLSTQVNAQFSDINQQISEYVSQINQYAQQLASVNDEIAATNFAQGDTPNELLDLQDSLLLNISAYVGIMSNVQDNGAVNVFVGNGQSLVVGTQNMTLGLQNNPSDPSLLDILLINNSYSQDITNGLSGGTLGGLLSVRESTLPQILNTLGEIAISIAMTMNAQNCKGMDLNGDLGQNLFNDPNSLNSQLNRVLDNINNAGNAIFGASINPIGITNTTQIYSHASNLTTAGTLSPLVSNMLMINGTSIRPTVAGDDIFSTSDPLGSAIAISNAINASSFSTFVTATPSTTALYLGKFTTGALATGNFQINGVNVITTGIDEATLLNSINALSAQTGITAVGDSNLNITLFAQDGRNIQVTTNGTAPIATFANFNTMSGHPLNQVQSAQIQLVSQNGASIIIGGTYPSAIGLSPTSPISNANILTTNDYELSYDGVYYSLRRVSDQSLAAQSTIPSLLADGLTITLLSGTMIQGDLFLVKPMAYGASEFALVLENPAQLAIAYPVAASAQLSNKGTGQILVTDITNTTGTPPGTSTRLGNAFSSPYTLTPPIQIQFISDSYYRVYDVSQGFPGIQIGPDQYFDSTINEQEIFPITSVIDSTLPGPNAPYVYDPGYRVSIQGIPVAGDLFSINYNTNAAGDNRNGLMLLNLQYEKTMLNNTSTFQDVYAQFVSEVGSQTSQAQISLDANQTIFRSIQSQNNQVSGVNLDEEAANLLKFEQAYQACAQVIVIARSVFDSLIRALGG